MKPLVSIVVPVYNMEKYLDRCLDSLITQDLKEIEIITVNDGSTDTSRQILSDYAQKDSRIIVLDQPNGGVSSARNFGIQVSQGKYIGFVDPDDWIDPEMYKDMYQTAFHHQADIVMCSYMREFSSHSKEKEFHLPSRMYIQDEEVKSKIMRRLVGPLNEEVASPELLDSWGTVWSKLYRTTLIKENGLQFVDLQEIGTNEDSLFNIQAFYHTNSFVFINQPYYHYWRENSQSVTSGYKPNLIQQWGTLHDYIHRYIREKQLNNDFDLALRNRICIGTLGLGLNTISKRNTSSPLMKIKSIKSILNETQIKRSFKQLDLSHFPIVWKAFYFCAKIRSAAGLYVMLITIDRLRKLMR